MLMTAYFNNIMKLKTIIRFCFTSSLKRPLIQRYGFSQQKSNKLAQQLSKKAQVVAQNEQCKQPENKLNCFPYVDLSMNAETRKQMDLDLSNFYKQILQRQRARMQNNQRRVQQLLNLEKERADRKQQQIRDQIKQFLKSLRAMIGLGGVLGLIYYFLTVINEGGDAVEKLKKYWDVWSSEYELIQKYSQGEERVPKYYLPENSIQKQLQKIQFDGIIGLSYIIGTPGTGKSTALKKVVNKLRKNIKQNQKNRWLKVYYINLRVDDENGKILLQKTKQRIQEMSKLLKTIFLDQNNYEKALVIIDDIQMLEKVLTQNQAKQKLQSIVFKCEMQSCKFIAVSSSSFSCYKALQNSNFRRSAYISQIQNLSKQQLKQVIDKRIKHERQCHELQIPQSVIQYLYKYDSIRAIMQSIGLIANQIRINKLRDNQLSEQSLLQKLRQYDSYRIWQMKLQCIEMLRQKSEKLGEKQLAYILQSILDLPSQIKLGHKFEIINQVVLKFPRLHNYLDEIASVIDQLDKRNLLIFGHPRSQLQRQALVQLLAGFQ